MRCIVCTLQGTVDYKAMLISKLFCRKGSMDGVGKQVCKVTLHTTGGGGRQQVRKVTYAHTAMCRRRQLLLEVSGPDPSQCPLLVAISGPQRF
jgi:hypothetical protein